jgi:hypothetical protein
MVLAVIQPYVGPVQGPLILNDTWWLELPSVASIRHRLGIQDAVGRLAAWSGFIVTHEYRYAVY